LEHQKLSDELEIFKQKEITEIESNKFKQMIEVIGAETIVSISNAGPET